MAHFGGGDQHLASSQAEELPEQVARLTRRFYARDPLSLAEALLGRMFMRYSLDGLTGGRIVEVEAYRGQDDPGSHAFRRMTPRNRTMFGPPGHLYVYFTYGMHHCANIVGEASGVAGAVLLRAIEPIVGLEVMSARRGTDVKRMLARGPGRLCQAMGIDLSDDGLDLATGEAWVSRSRRLKGSIRSSSRVGLRRGTEHPWRLYEEGPWVSGPGFKPVR